MRWTWCVIVGVLAGCDSGAPDCDKAVMAATKQFGAQDGREIATILTKSCESSWTGAQRTCVATAKRFDAVLACVPDLGPQLEIVRAKVKEIEAKAAFEQSVKDAAEAADKLQKLSTEVDALNDKVSKAVDAVLNAQNDADRAAAKAVLTRLQKDKADLEQRVTDAKATAARAERMKGVHISKECLDNPLAKGCQ